ncbi:MAG: zf-HC2 domain-containing protein [Nitrospinota bacterium]
MECEKVKQLLSEYMDGTLDVHMKEFVEEHFKICKGCLEELVSLETYLVSLEAYINELGSLKRVEAPQDFLEKVHQRLERRFEFKKIVRKIFVPIRIKVPLELIAVAATVLLVIYISKDIQPIKEIAYAPSVPETGKIAKERIKEEKQLAPEKRITKPPSVSDESAVSDPAVFRKRRIEETGKSAVKERDAEPGAVLEQVAALPPLKEEKPMELDLLIKIEGPARTYTLKESGHAERTAKMKERGKAEVQRSTGMSVNKMPVYKDTKGLKSSYLNEVLSRVKNLIVLADGEVISVEYEKGTKLPQYITTRIPVVNYNTFLRKLGRVGTYQEPLPSETTEGEGSISLRIKFIPSG